MYECRFPLLVSLQYTREIKGVELPVSLSVSKNLLILQAVKKQLISCCRLESKSLTSTHICKSFARKTYVFYLA